MYEFSRINHPVILTYTVLISLTPLIPVPVLDDIVKMGFQRRLIRQIASARGRTLSAAEMDALTTEGVGCCLGGCVYTGIIYPVREILSKVLFVLEWKRSLDLVSRTYYFGFLLDAALLDGYPIGDPERGSPAHAEVLRQWIVYLQKSANAELIKRIFRQSIRPRILFRSIGALIRESLARIPQFFGAIWQSIQRSAGSLRGTPGKIRSGVTGLLASLRRLPERLRGGFYQRVQSVVEDEPLPEHTAVERIAQSMQQLLVKLPSAPFDELHRQLAEALGGSKA